jgi:hypothetical protein
VDWQYYTDRLSRSIQKIVTIPAGLQRIDNPCPRVVHPDWLKRSITERANGLKQSKISSMFTKIIPGTIVDNTRTVHALTDLEELPSGIGSGRSLLKGGRMAGTAVAYNRSKRPISQIDNIVNTDICVTEIDDAGGKENVDGVEGDGPNPVPGEYLIPVLPMMTNKPSNLEELNEW